MLLPFAGRVQRGFRRALQVTLTLAVLASGCLSAPESPPMGDAGPPPVPGIEPDRFPPAGNLTVQVRQDPDRPYAARLLIDITVDPPPGTPRTLHLQATSGDARSSASLQFSPTRAPTAATRLELGLPPGQHAVQITATWDNETQPSAHHNTTATIWVPVTLIVNASSPYADGQNIFQTTHTIPLAPWIDESGHVLLDRAATRHGFPYDTPYNEELDSYYVEMVNNTAEEWMVDGVISHSWMILHNGQLAQRAIDDVRPQAGDTIELRFVRCWSTGNCEGV